MNNKRRVGMVISGVIGFGLFSSCLGSAMLIVDAYKEGTSADLSLWSFLLPIALFFATGACAMVFEHFRLADATGSATSPPGVKIATRAKIDEGKLLGGLLLVGIAIFEFFSSYLAENYLIPYQQTELLRNFFSSGLLPILIGLFGLGLIYGGLKSLWVSIDED